jgi:hypothetical protein
VSDRVVGYSEVHHENTGLDSYTKAAIAMTGISAGIELIQVAAKVAIEAGEKLYGVLENLVETGSKFEKFNIQFTALLGTAQLAKERMKELSDLESPFDIQQLVAATRELEVFGIYSKRTLEAIGDASIAVDKSIAETADVLVDASAGSFERLREYGISALDLEKQVGHKLVLDTQEGLDEITEAVIAMFEKRFGGAMGAMTHSAGGMINELKEYWEKFKLEISDAGVFDTVKGILDAMLTTVKEIFATGTAESAAESIGAALVFALKLVVLALVEVGTVLEQAARDIISVFDWFARQKGWWDRQNAGVPGDISNAILYLSTAGLVGSEQRLGQNLGLSHGGTAAAGATGPPELFMEVFERNLRANWNMPEGMEWTGGPGGPQPRTRGIPTPKPTKSGKPGEIVNTATDWRAVAAWEAANVGEEAAYWGEQNRPALEGITGQMTEAQNQAEYDRAMEEHRADQDRKKIDDISAQMGIEEALWEEHYAKQREGINKYYKYTGDVTMRYFDKLMETSSKWKKIEDITLKGILKSAKEAVVESLSVFIAEWGRKAAVRSAWEAAEALAALATGDARAAAGHGAAALEFAALATGAAIGSGMLAGSLNREEAVNDQDLEREGATKKAASTREVSRSVGITTQTIAIYVNIYHNKAAVYGADGLADLAREQVVPAILDCLQVGSIPVPA